MPYFIVQASDNNCLYLTCEGDVTLGEMTAAWQEVRELLAVNGWKKVLLDVTALESSLQMEHVFDLAKLFWKEFPKDGRIALVIRWDHQKSAALLEMLVRCVGIYLTVFVSQDLAEAWILENATAGELAELSH
ncbi:MAG TPA: hypothetical protein VF988_10970 [Verrucomicrobiae bacterium]